MTTDLSSNHRIRVKVFVDFWNFQLAISGVDRNFRVDWDKLGWVVAREALKIVDVNALLSYEGMNVYGSYGPKGEKDDSLRYSATKTLSRFPGVEINFVDRQPRTSGIVCPSCHKVTLVCPHCQSEMRGTEEKGVDTGIATDMFSLAWEKTYDVAVLISSDRDFVPIVEFLSARGIKTIHGGLLRQGSRLTQACWGNLRLERIMEQFSRA